ncbi:hypothetical protein Y1Q_0017561 [Alligator mississippiensis]|uniref:Uncharacterized protein n=1 Tax=Alligator mississippiensis TaxID=8496 RepID=A0A151P2G8_ALLMI|nr:hypothetical protein Y1Q_0017561 [Alligator mississippiensis]
MRSSLAKIFLNAELGNPYNKAPAVTSGPKHYMHTQGNLPSYYLELPPSLDWKDHFERLKEKVPENRTEQNYNENYDQEQ